MIGQRGRWVYEIDHEKWENFHQLWLVVVVILLMVLSENGSTVLRVMSHKKRPLHPLSKYKWTNIEMRELDPRRAMTILFTPAIKCKCLCGQQNTHTQTYSLKLTHTDSIYCTYVWVLRKHKQNTVTFVVFPIYLMNSFCYLFGKTFIFLFFSAGMEILIDFFYNCSHFPGLF